MVRKFAPLLAEAVRRTLTGLDRATEPGDPAFAKIKSKALLRLAETIDETPRPRARVLVVRPKQRSKATE
jgi:hypothetical protein